MTKKKATSIIEPKKVEELRELTEEQLDRISGGKVQPQDFHFVKRLDKASP